VILNASRKDNLANQLYKFFFVIRRSDINFLTCYRVSIGSFVLCHFLGFVKDFNLFYSQHAIISPELMRYFRTGVIPDFSQLSKFSFDAFGLSQSTVQLIFTITFIVLCVCLIIGFLSRISSLILLALHLILVQGTPLFSYGVDYLTTIALFYCIVLPLGYEYSVDKVIFKLGDVNPSPYRKLLQIHLCIIYFTSGIVKIVGADWRSGAAIWESLHLLKFDPIVSFDFGFLARHQFVTLITSWFVLVIEILYPFFVWKNPYKNIGLLSVCLMHIGIAVFLGLYFFSFLMIILSITAFVDLSLKFRTSLNKQISILGAR